MSESRLTRRDLLRVSTLATGAVALAACTGATPSSAPAATAVPVVTMAPVAASVGGAVSMWTFPMTEDDMGQIWNPLTTRFKEAYPDISVNVELVPWGGRREKMLTAYAGGEAPDMAYLNVVDISLWGTNAVLMPLDDMIPTESWDDMSGNLIEGLTWDGERLMFPASIFFYARLYNKGLFAEVGLDPETPPATWGDLRVMGAAAKAKDYFLTNISTMTWDHQMITPLWQAGGRLFNEDFTKVQLDSEAAFDTWSLEADMFKNGWVPKEGAVGSDAEASATAATNFWVIQEQILSGNGNADNTVNTQSQAPEIDFGLCPTLKHKRQVVMADGASWAIFKDRPEIDPVAKWLLWLIEPEQQAFYCSACKILPSRVSAMPYWKAEPMVREFCELHLPYIELTGDATHFFQEGKVICAPYRQAAALGLSTVEEALAGAQAEFQTAVDEWNEKRNS